MATCLEKALGIIFSSLPSLCILLLSASFIFLSFHLQSDGLPREMNERNAANLGQKNVEEENERIASIDLGDKGTTDSERGLNIQVCQVSV